VAFAVRSSATLQTHLVGVIGLVVVFVVGTLRPVNLGALGLVATFLVGTFAAAEDVRAMLAGFPVDLLVLLTGVTYLFGIATNNGTVALVVEGAARLVRDRPALVPWLIFAVAALPAMAGALGSAGIALLAPIALRLARRYDIDPRLIGLMLVHGAAAGNFSPLNVLGAIVRQAAARNGVDLAPASLFVGNLAYNVALALVIATVFARRGPAPPRGPAPVLDADDPAGGRPGRLRLDQACSIAGLFAVAVGALGYGLDIGLLALTAAVILQLCFPRTSGDAAAHIAWGVVLLVCGIVTYVAALQRYGTVAAVGSAIAHASTPLVGALLLCSVGAVTSAFASSAGILSAMVPLAVPLMAEGRIEGTGLIVALAVSATVVDAAPFSTVGALVVANAEQIERRRVYQGLLAWAAVMVVTAPVVTWLIFIVVPSV
jgi:di/tricarboxylate transporter